MQLEKQKRLRVLRKILRFVIIGSFIWRDVDKKIAELTAKKNNIIDNLRGHVNRELETVAKNAERIKNSGTYLIYPDKERMISYVASIDADLEYLQASKALEQDFLLTNMKRVEECRKSLLTYNSEFIKQQKIKYSYLFNKDNLSFDEEQKDAVVTDDKYNLVVAGAGSGKTEVLITRIAYLIQRKPATIPPQRILAIAYQRKAKEEIEQRLRDRYGMSNVNVSTFHKLGKDILERTGKKFRHTDIINENKKHELIRTVFESLLKSSPDYYKLFLQYVKTLHDFEREDSELDKRETLAYMRQRPYYSINGTRVNSQAEKEIMDFFLMNKLDGKCIKVEYEPDVNGFRPDFYLTGCDLLIEHWALDQMGQVPSWFTEDADEYRKNMERKKEWFAQHKKLLVETFTCEYDEHNAEKFLELLENRIVEKLEERDQQRHEFTSMTYDEIAKVAWGPYKSPVDEIVNFVTNAKTYGLKPQRIVEKLQDGVWSSKQLAFGNLAVRMYRIYEEELRNNNKIDFEDMINSAIQELTNDNGLYADVYDHILIDEYQDMSAQRQKLIDKLLERNPNCRLFCVGDDWQNIMGFAGSNLTFFVNFDQYFKNPAISKISTNYRSLKSIVDAGADLIKNNGQIQISKTTLSNRTETKPIRVFRSPHKEKYEKQYYRQTAEHCLNRITEYLQNGYAPKDILILNRYMRTRMDGAYKLIPSTRTFIEKARERGIEIAHERIHEENQVRLLTAHKSKGLEAKVVFILDVTKGTYGFPCEIEDSSIYVPARENYPKQDQKQEERRLFYVAMTRAKEDLMIYTREHSKSEFLNEIQNHTTEERLTY